MQLLLDDAVWLFGVCLIGGMWGAGALADRWAAWPLVVVSRYDAAVAVGVWLVASVGGLLAATTAGIWFWLGV